MRLWWVLFRKELLESSRNFKWLWMPCVFIIFGITEPLTAFYLPDILDAVGNLPEGTVIEIPKPTAGEVLLSTIGQYSTFGLLIVVLAFMGTVAGERKSGSAAMILVKPVSYLSYIFAKWAAALLLVLSSYSVGMMISWYYINLLFESITATSFFQTFVIFGAWLVFVLTLTVFFSSLVKMPGIAAFATIGITVILSFLSGTIENRFTWLPSNLTAYAQEILLLNKWSNDATITLVLTLSVSCLLIIVTPLLFKKKELL